MFKTIQSFLALLVFAAGAASTPVRADAPVVPAASGPWRSTPEHIIHLPSGTGFPLKFQPSRYGLLRSDPSGRSAFVQYQRRLAVGAMQTTVYVYPSSRGSLFEEFASASTSIKRFRAARLVRRGVITSRGRRGLAGVLHGTIEGREISEFLVIYRTPSVFVRIRRTQDRSYMPDAQTVKLLQTLVLNMKLPADWPEAEVRGAKNRIDPRLLK